MKLVKAIVEELITEKNSMFYKHVQELKMVKKSAEKNTSVSSMGSWLRSFW